MRIIFCCRDMERAFESGTDGESYGALFFECGGIYKGGGHETPLKYCPWCGKNITVEEINERLKGVRE